MQVWVSKRTSKTGVCHCLLLLNFNAESGLPDFSSVESKDFQNFARPFVRVYKLFAVRHKHLSIFNAELAKVRNDHQKTREQVGVVWVIGGGQRLKVLDERLLDKLNSRLILKRHAIYNETPNSMIFLQFGKLLKPNLDKIAIQILLVEEHW